MPIEQETSACGRELGRGGAFGTILESHFFLAPPPGLPLGRSVEASLGPFSCWSHPRPLFFPFLAPTHGFAGGWGRVYALVELGNQV